MASSIRLLGFSGSLRKKSYNTAALMVARASAPEGVAFDTFDLNGIPLYNEDVKAQGMPEVVVSLRETMAPDDVRMVT